MYQKELLKGNTETLLLSILSVESMHGYRIIKEIDQRSSGYFRFKDGTLYPALHRLEAAELIKGYWGQSSTGTARRYYSITPKGQDMLADRLEEWRRFTQAVNLVMPAWATQGATG
ncbi:PadR family transcriptional regulator [SAR202 cluster bacterium AD-804-J14_MRT_500m]|nr:PadR family transcriptional regulator [SAR202 cluster bacterium AD-804-J14_MRT_500m]